MSNVEIPHHLREAVFKDYEWHIEQVVFHYPGQVVFNPAPLAATTFSCRFRDAVNSLLRFGWRCDFDVEKLRLIWEDVDTLITGNGTTVTVCVGAGKGRKTVVPVKLSADNTFAYTLHGPLPAVVHSLCILIKHGVITTPCKLFDVSDQVLADVKTRYGISVLPEDDYVIIML